MNEDVIQDVVEAGEELALVLLMMRSTRARFRTQMLTYTVPKILEEWRAASNAYYDAWESEQAVRGE